MFPCVSTGVTLGQIVVFKRFTQAMDEQVKNDTLVRFPLEGLDLSPYMPSAGSPAVSTNAVPLVTCGPCFAWIL